MKTSTSELLKRLKKSYGVNFTQVPIRQDFNLFVAEVHTQQGLVGIKLKAKDIMVQVEIGNLGNGALLFQKAGSIDTVENDTGFKRIMGRLVISK